MALVAAHSFLVKTMFGKKRSYGSGVFIHRFRWILVVVAMMDVCGWGEGGHQVVKTQSLARHAFPESVLLREHSARLHGLMHTPQGFLLHSSFVVLKRKLCHRHVDDRIHMHFHGNSTDTQHHIAHTHEVSLGSKTQLRNSQILRGVRVAVY